MARAREQGRARRFVLVLFVFAVSAGMGLYGYFRHAVRFPGAAPWARDTVEARLGRALEGQRTTDAAVGIEFFPDERRIVGRASLSLKSLRDERTEFCLFLNPGLKVSGVSAAEGALSYSQRAGVLKVLANRPLAMEEDLHLIIDYAGTPEPMSLASCWISENHVRLPGRSLWYPTDLQSFCPFECTATVPNSMIVAARQLSEVTPSDDGKRVVRWRSERPINSMPFVADHYTKAVRTHGTSECVLFWDEQETVQPQACLEAAGAAHGTLNGLLRDDRFGGVVLVVEPGVSEVEYAGASTLFVPARLVNAHPQTLFAEMARALAHNWWGGMVTARWFPSRPEGGAWLCEGLSEYSAWLALRTHFGRTAALRHVESLRCPSTNPFSMRGIGMVQLAEEPDQYMPFARIRGAHTAAVLAEAASDEAFLLACRNLLAVHHYAPISLAAFQQELELASEVDMGEIFRLWFDRPGTFDYALSDVMAEDGRIRIVVRNEGNIPASSTMAVALVSNTGVDLRRIDVGAGGGSFVLESTDPIRRVVLDALFSTPDMKRANNVWPRRLWPEHIAAASDGAIALAARDHWNADGASEVQIVIPGDPEKSTIRLPHALGGAMLWSPDASRLALSAGSVHVWGRSSSGCQTVLPENVQAIGWDGSSLLAAPAEGAGPWQTLDANGNTQRLAARGAAPLPGTVSKHPTQALYAYVSVPDRSLHLLDALEGADRVVAPGRRVAGNAVWTNDGEKLVFVDQSGVLLKGHPAEDTWEALMEPGYPIRECAVAPGGLRAAWTDPEGVLTIGDISTLRTQRVHVPGEIVDFSWEASSALICLAAETHWALPMLFHADYSVWRVPMDTMQPERVAWDRSGH